MRAIVFCAVVALGTLAESGAVLACSPYQGAKSIVDSADIIFVGTAIRSQWDITEQSAGARDLITTTFNVRRTIKGEPGDRIDLTHDFPLAGNCGVVFAPGQTALILAVCEEGICGTNSMTMGLHLTEEHRAELLSLLNVDEPRPFGDEKLE